MALVATPSLMTACASSCPPRAPVARRPSAAECSLRTPASGSGRRAARAQEAGVAERSLCICAAAHGLRPVHLGGGLGGRAERRARLGRSAAGGAGSGAPLGSEGLRSLLEEAASSLGHCRFIVSNPATGGILESVCDFGAAPLRYSEPSERGTFCTLAAPGAVFEAHLNVDKVSKVVFASPERPKKGGGGTYSMYVMRFLGPDGKAVALSVLLHSTDFEAGAYGDGCGNPEAWAQLRDKYGEEVDVQ